ncbi:MAG: hypothetical protein AABX04_03320 [Nanoarchaeota archaeon]|mgnify:CR=1 FL=1
MFDNLIKIALKSALENPEIREKLRRKSEEIKINIMETENKNNKIIDLDKNSYKVLEE